LGSCGVHCFYSRDVISGCIQDVAENDWLSEAGVLCGGNVLKRGSQLRGSGREECLCKRLEEDMLEMASLDNERTQKLYKKKQLTFKKQRKYFQ